MMYSKSTIKNRRGSLLWVDLKRTFVYRNQVCKLGFLDP